MPATTPRIGGLPWATAVLFVPDQRGPMTAAIGGFVARQRLPADSTGIFSLTLVNIVVGSAIQIETQAGAVIENRTADTASEVFSLPAYTPGSANNDLRIKVRKGSASPFYLPYETLATALVGAQSIFVSQVPDE